MTLTITNEQKIRTLAFGIWQSEGCPHGRDLDHWLAAEREIMSMGYGTITGTSKNAYAEPTTSRDSETAPVSGQATGAAKSSTLSGRTGKSTLVNPGKKRIHASYGKKSPPPA